MARNSQPKNTSAVDSSRRTFLRRSAAALGTVAAAPILSACDIPFLSKSAEPFEMPVEDGEEALKRLVEGNKRFAEGKSKDINESKERRDKVAKRQRPFAMVLSCVDSRVPPELIFDRGLGDLFVSRTAGEVVDSAVLGSLEYGAYELEVPLLLVLGHEKCGAVKATMEAVESGAELGGSLDYLVKSIRPAVKGVHTEVKGVVMEQGAAAADHSGTDHAATDSAATEAPAELALTPEIGMETATAGGAADEHATSELGSTGEPASESAAEAAAAAKEEAGGATVSEETVAEETVTEETVTEETVAEETTADGEPVKPKVEKVDPLSAAIARNVSLVIAKVTASPIIADRIKKDRLLVVGGVYDLETGLVKLTDNVPESLKPKEEPKAVAADTSVA